jgi:pimeloyl-ACP methyl ester carboxylesterase
MANWEHRYAKINGIDMHWVEEGQGPLVVLCHGFPHLWFSWRHQIPVIVAAGWRVVALDMRGMGQTEAPADPSQYDCDHTVGDLCSSVSISASSRPTTLRSAIPSGCGR